MKTPLRSRQTQSAGKTMPLFSVIMPVYNGETFLKQAIDSILYQSLTDFELLVVDDGSTDNSLSLIQELTASLDNEVLILRHPSAENRGIVSTYELGLAPARGEYVAFLEQDYYWSPRYLEHNAAIFEKFPGVGVVFSPYQIVTQGWFGRDMTLRQWILGWSLPKNRPFDNFANLLRRNNIATFSCFTIRRPLLAQLTAPPDRAIVYYDWWMLLQLTIHTQFFRDEQSLCYWRQGRGSTLGSQRLQTHQKRLVDFLQTLEEFLDKKRCDLPSGQLAADHSFRSKAHLAIAFAQDHHLTRFLPFFTRDPSWAMQFLVSAMINYMKFSGNDSRSYHPPSGGSSFHDHVGNLSPGIAAAASKAEQAVDSLQ
ncbi:MAG: glycosyltransferase family 2 protein [Pirellulaceae bacterium]